MAVPVTGWGPEAGWAKTWLGLAEEDDSRAVCPGLLLFSFLFESASRCAVRAGPVPGLTVRQAGAERPSRLWPSLGTGLGAGAVYMAEEPEA